MTVFTIYYLPTGQIHSYLEGGLLPPEEQTPKGCQRVCYDRIMPIFDLKSFRVNAKIDPQTLHILPINEPQILTQNPPNAVDGPVVVPYDPNSEIRHVSSYSA